MNDTKDSGEISEKKKNTIPIKNENDEKWTFSRSVLFLLITFDMVIVLVWLFYYYSSYEIIARLVGAMWFAVTTFLGFMKIKKASEISFCEFLGLLPVKMVIITYTIIIFVLAAVFIFIEFPVHSVHITAYLNNSPKSNVSITWNDKQYQTIEDGSIKIQSVQVGTYTLIGNLTDYIPDTSIVNVLWWKKTHHYRVLFDSTDFIPPPLPEPGTLGNVHISSSFRRNAFNDADIYIDGEKQNKQTPYTLKNILKGYHLIKLVKINGEYFYKGEKEITVEPDRTSRITIELEPPKKLCKLLIRSNPTGAHIYINEEPFGTTNRIVRLVPGRHIIRLEKNRYRTTEEEIFLTRIEDIKTITLQKE